MMNWEDKEIQIVAFAVPYPPDYGGVLDVYYKIKALIDIGIKVHLHAWQYKDHLPHPALKELCTDVIYYPRNLSSRYLLGWPYIVSSRYNKNLLYNILRKGHPVVLEGLHTAWLIPYLKEKKIRHVLRMHNIEWKYYQMLASQEASFTRKKYFMEESVRLKQYEKIISTSELLAISPADETYLKQQYPLADTRLIYPFHGHNRFDIIEGKGEYALFHGNLSVNENESAAIWLIQEVFSGLTYPLVIAGKRPSERLKQIIDPYRHIRLVADPSTEAMEHIQQQAHIHLLPNRQPTGMKLKWVNALFTARFIVAHPDMSGQGLPDAGIWSAQHPHEYIHLIQSLRDRTFPASAAQSRMHYMGRGWNNRDNAESIAGILLK